MTLEIWSSFAPRRMEIFFYLCRKGVDDFSWNNNDASPDRFPFKLLCEFQLLFISILPIIFYFSHAPANFAWLHLFQELRWKKNLWSLWKLVIIQKLTRTSPFSLFPLSANTNLERKTKFQVFSRVHATLQTALSVGRWVG